MLESLLVGLIVAAAAVYAAWALTPAVTRNRLALRAAAALAGSRTTGLAAHLAARLRSLAKAPTSGCSGCSSQVETPAERAAREQAPHRR